MNKMSVEELMQRIKEQAEDTGCLYCIRHIRSDQVMKSIREELERYLENRDINGQGNKWIYERNPECGMLIIITLKNQPNGLDIVSVSAHSSE